jgi:quercetin dioxygenase-like cupin family protein
MRFTRLLAVMLLPASIAAASAQHASTHGAGAATPNATSTPIIRSDRTISGQPLKLPQGAAEMVAAAVEIPAGGVTTIHQHPWSRFVYVERGPVRITNHDTGEVKQFATGAMFSEVVAQWHEGRALETPARLIVIDLVPPGANNMIMR